MSENNNEYYKTHVSELLDALGSIMREPTDQERESIDRYIKEHSTETWVNFYDAMNEMPVKPGQDAKKFFYIKSNAVIEAPNKEDAMRAFIATLIKDHMKVLTSSDKNVVDISIIPVITRNSSNTGGNDK